MLFTTFDVAGIYEFLDFVLDVASFFGTEELFKECHKLEALNLLERSAGLPEVEGVVAYSLDGQVEEESEVQLRNFLLVDLIVELELLVCFEEDCDNLEH